MESLRIAVLRFPFKRPVTFDKPVTCACIVLFYVARRCDKMLNLVDHPVLALVVSLLIFWFSACIGGAFRKWQGDLDDDIYHDFVFVLSATHTLLGLIVAFTLVMAVNRYDQRKNYEEEETNAIGTEFVRAELLPAPDAARVRALLKRYLDQRVLDYETRNEPQIQQIDAQTARLQAEMWSAVATPAAAQPTPVASLVLSGMNDVLNSQGYTAAAWRNRIPIAAWALLIMVSIFCNLMIGYSAHARSSFLFIVLPIALSITLFLIADVDSPRGGVIRVRPQNLESLVESLHSQ